MDRNPLGNEAFDNRKQSPFLAVRNYIRVNFAFANANAENDCLASSASATLAPYPARTEIAFVKLHGALGYFVAAHALMYAAADLHEIAVCRDAAKAGKLGGLGRVKIVGKISEKLKEFPLGNFGTADVPAAGFLTDWHMSVKYIFFRRCGTFFLGKKKFPAKKEKKPEQSFFFPCTKRIKKAVRNGSASAHAKTAPEPPCRLACSE